MRMRSAGARPFGTPPFPLWYTLCFPPRYPPNNPTCFAGPPPSTRCVIPTVRMLYVFVLQHTHHTFPLVCPFAFLTHPLSTTSPCSAPFLHTHTFTTRLAQRRRQARGDGPRLSGRCCPSLSLSSSSLIVRPHTRFMTRPLMALRN